MKNLILAAAVTLFAASAAQAQQAVQWKVSDGGNGHWYAAIRPAIMPSTFAGHDAFAQSIGASMATLKTQQELAFAIGTLSGLSGESNGAFFGLRRQANGSWRWVDGTSPSFTAWGGSNCGSGPYPNNQGISGEMVGHLYRRECGWIWDDTPPSWQGLYQSLTLLVEWDSDCNGDGIVDYGQCRDGSLPDYNGNNIPDCCEGGTPCTVGNYPVQWRDTEGGNGHWYQKIGPFSSWEAARSASVAQGGHLMTITGQAEWDYVFFNIQPQPYGGTVLGGYQVPGSPEPGVWRWVTDEPWPSFINFAGFDDCPGGPSGACGSTCFLPNQQDFLMFGWFGGTNPNQWFDDVGGDFTRDCGATQRYAIIEWSADCNGDGIVDQGQILRGLLPDTNINGIPDLCETPDCYDADFFRDRFVNGADLGILLIQWGPNGQYTVSDLNHDGIVDANDLGLFLSLWGPCPY